MLAASNKTALLTAINVPKVDDEYAYRVAASFSMGTAVNTVFSSRRTVTSGSCATWQPTWTWGGRAKTRPMMINGVTSNRRSCCSLGRRRSPAGNKNVDYGRAPSCC